MKKTVIALLVILASVLICVSCSDSEREMSFCATVKEVGFDNITLTVIPADGTSECRYADEFVLKTNGEESYAPGEQIIITFDGELNEIYHKKAEITNVIRVEKLSMEIPALTDLPYLYDGNT